MSDKYRRYIEFHTPWSKSWPLSAGFRLDVLSAGFYRYAGDGYGISLAVLSFELVVKWYPRSLDINQPLNMQMRAKL